MISFQHIVVISITLLLAACGGPQHARVLDPHYSEQSLRKLRSNYSTHTINNSIVKLHAVSIKDTESYPVVMIHGTPGNWSTFSFILGNTKLQERNHLISVDRLDWGQSLNSSPNKQSPEFEDQVEAIAAIIRSTTDKPVILVGHSLGASLVPSVAIKHPDLVRGMIIVAGTVDPDLGQPRWFNRIAKLKIVQWFISDELINANREVYKLKPGLADVKPDWQNLNIPVTVIQGSKDKLVDPENVQYVKKQYDNKQELLDLVILDKSGHFIPWEHPNEIIKAIQRMTDRFE